MGGSFFGGSGPEAPNMTQAAEQQAASSKPTQVNPFAQSQWSRDRWGNWTQNVGLQGGAGQAATNLENQIGSQGALGTGDQARQQAIDAIYGQAQSRLDPQWAQTREQNQAQLANQGLDPGSEAYQTQMGNVSRAQNDAYSTAMNNAIQGGTAAQQATFGENLAAQNAPYQQLGALSGLTQGSNFAQGQPTNYLGAATAGYQNALQGYGVQQQGKNSGLAGAAQLAGTAAMFL